MSEQGGRIVEENHVHLLEEIERYHLHLGRFVTRFAEVEALLRVLCAALSKMPVDAAGIVFGNLTVSSGIEMLRSLRRANDHASDADLERALNQLKRIAETRNAILHRGVEFSFDSFRTKAGLPNSRGREHEVSSETTEAMNLDLNPISVALVVSIPVDDPGFLVISEGFRGAARTPWRYTPEP